MSDKEKQRETPEQTAREPAMNAEATAALVMLSASVREAAALIEAYAEPKARIAHDDALEKAADAAQANCAACGGDGYGPTVVAAYPDANGDPVPEQSQCECCGRQVTAIRALKREA